MKPEALVSIIVNCYNGEKYLRKAIDSILSQTYKNFEIIFWDNQSTDGSAALFNSYKDLRFRYFKAPIHTLLYEARNYAIEKASGEFIAFLDVDDKWLPNKLEKQMLCFADPEVGLVCGNFWIKHERKHKMWIALSKQVATGWVLNNLLESNFVGLLTLVVRKSAFDMLSYPCDKRYHIIGDFDLVIRLSINWKLEFVKEPIALYRIHGNNESSKHRDRHINEWTCWLNEMESNEAIRTCESWYMVVNNFIYLQAIDMSLQGRKKEVFKLLCRLPFGIQKLRLLLAILLPTIIINHIKN